MKIKEKIRLTVMDNRVEQIVNLNAEVETIDDSAVFTEGPVWNAEGFYLFSDIPKNSIYKIVPGQGKEIFLENSGCTIEDTTLLSQQIGSNGLAYDRDGNLMVCQHGNGAVAVYKNKQLAPLVATNFGDRLNSPNDLVVHPDGSIFFSDPPYGLKEQQLNPHFAQQMAGVYCYRNGRLELVCDKYQYPNGVCLSPDKKILYCCSNKESEKFVLAYDTEGLQFLRKVADENGDGIKCDGQGNLYLCTKEGILIIDGTGKRMGLIKLETVPANCCFGGRDYKDLFITARQHIFLIRDFLR